MKVVLVGYMGSGKSTIGQLIAKKLKLPFYDLDAYIEGEERKSISILFKEKGELYFRKKEHYYLEDLLKKDDYVLSVGGGTPCYGFNMDLIIKASPFVFYLNVPIMVLAKRLSLQKTTRPLIAAISDADLPEFIGKHIFERNYFYNKAHVIIHCEEKQPEDIALQIVKQILS